MVRLLPLLLVACAGGEDELDPGDSDTPTPTPTADTSDTDTDPPAPDATNVLVVLLDDIGIDKVRAYHPAAPDLPPQPTLDRLSEDGIRFVNTWTQPLCSPTRAALLTGRHARRTGIGAYIPIDDVIELPLSEITLAEVLRDAEPAYATAALGKWHLSTLDSPSGLDHPNLQGFGLYRGWIGNLGSGGRTYTSYPVFENGVEIDIDEAYATTQTVDDALAFIEGASEPWFAWVATHAVHTPVHEPPADLHDQDLDTSSTGAEVFAAMVQATDAELGRLLDSIDPDVLARTHVVVLGDNGTLGALMVPPFDPDRDKGTLYEGGVRVPMWVLGPTVTDPGGVREQLFHAVDLLPTVAALVGVTPPDQLDGVDQSAVWADAGAPPARTMMYADSFKPLGPGPYVQEDERAVRDATHKLLLDAHTGLAALFRVPPDDVFEGAPLDLSNLSPDDAAAYERLSLALEEASTDVVYGPRAP